MKKIFKTSARDGAVVNNVKAAGIVLSNIGLLKDAVLDAGSGYNVSSSFDSFLPSAREEWANYQVIVMSSEGSDVISTIDEAFAGNDFIFCFRDQEVYEETISNEKKIVLNLGDMEGNKIKTLVSGGWFADGNEFKFALLIPKATKVFTRYTALKGSELGRKLQQGEDEEDENNSVNRFYPVIVMDELTRSKYHYPQIFAREFYAAVVAKYCTQSLDKYVISKSKYVAKVPGRGGQGDEAKPYELGQTALDSQINPGDPKSMYMVQAPFISREMADVMDGAYEFIDVSASSLYTLLAREALRGARGGVRTNIEPQTKELQRLRKILEEEPNHPDAEEINAAIQQLRQQISMGGMQGVSEVVFNVGQKLTEQMQSNRANAAKSSNVRESIRQFPSELSSVSSSPVQEDKIKMNLSSCWEKDFSVNYKTKNAPQAVQAGEFSPENGAPSYAFSFAFKVGGNAVYIPPQGMSPAEVKINQHTQKIDAGFETYDKTRNVSNAAELSEEIELYFQHILNAKTVPTGGIALSGEEQSIQYGTSESIRQLYDNDIRTLKNKINEIIADSYKYDFFVDKNIPSQIKIVNVNGKQTKIIMTPVEYIIALDEFLATLELVAPKPLRVVEDMLSKKKRVTEADISLIRIILEE